MRTFFRFTAAGAVIILIVVVLSLYIPSHQQQKAFSKNPEVDVTTRHYQLTDDVTVVTAYFNIGSFAKGAVSTQFTPSLYYKWMKVFSRLKSPLIGYFDDDKDLEEFRQQRQKLSSDLTVLHKVDRSKMWSFGLIPEISRIFAKPGYPKHLPNTVVPTYSAAMHAKYEVMQMAVKENPFKTRYFCWLDIGLFRDLVYQQENSPPFSLYLPADFRSDSVAYTEVYGPRDNGLSVKEIVYNNMVWVCGCFFIGEATVLYRWAEEYKTAVHRMIREHDLMSTDQQVIYVAFNTMNISTSIQLYKSDGRYNEWFHLGYLAKDAGQTRLPVLSVLSATLTPPQVAVSGS